MSQGPFIKQSRKAIETIVFALISYHNESIQAIIVVFANFKQTSSNDRHIS